MNYLEVARAGKNEWWRYLIGYPFILFIWLFVGAVPFVILAGFILGDNNPATDLSPTGFVGIDPTLNFTVNMLTFVPFFFATLMAVAFLHRRPAQTLITSNTRIDWNRLLMGFSAWFVISAALAFVEAVTHPGRYQFTFEAKNYILFAIVCIILVPLQSSAEEFFFRGYLIQNIGLKLKNPWVLSFLSGLLFTLPHLANPEVQENIYLVPLFYFFFGAFATYISLRDNGLELPLGMHAGNNLFTSLFVNATVTALPTPAVFTVAEFDVWYNLLSPLVGMAVFYVLMFKVWPKNLPEQNLADE